VDRRNGSFSRHLLTELGDIELCVLRTRGVSVPFKVLRAYGRRVRHGDRMILACFALGGFDSEGGPGAFAHLGEPVSATWGNRRLSVSGEVTGSGSRAFK
jgi:hypothetical protein